MISALNDAVIGACVVLSLLIVFWADAAGLKLLLAALVVLGIATSWPRLSPLVRACALVSLVAGAVGAVLVRAGTADLALGLSEMTSVFAFFVFVRLLEVPILTGRFNQAIARFLSQRARIRNRSAAGTLLAYGLTAGLSIGAVPIAYRSVEALWDDPARDDTRGMARVVAQGFTAANAWTPVSPIVAVTLDTTAAPLPSVLAWAIPMSLVAALATVWGCRSSGRVDGTAERQPSRSVGEFAVAILVLMASIVAVERVWHVGPLGASMVSIVLLVTAWQVRLEGPAAGARAVWSSVLAHRASWPEQFTLFCAGGVLVGAATALSRNLGATHGLLAGSTLLVVLGVPLAILVGAALGLYPLVSLAALGALLGPQVAADGTLALALALIVGASVAFLVSPFTGLTLLLSGMSARSSFDVAVRWNLLYGLGLLAGGTAVVALAYGVG